MPQSLAALLSARHIEYQLGAPMAQRTTLKVGGPAECLVEPLSAEDIIGALCAAKEAGAPVYIVGNGSNLLVRDTGLSGLVIVINRQMANAQVLGTQIIADAGAQLFSLARLAQQAGLSGLEALSGIPGTVGGTTCMNAGAYGFEMAGVVDTVEAIDPHASGGARMVVLSKEALRFGYRTSTIMRNGLIVTRVTLSLTPLSPVEIADKMNGYTTSRREKQPLNLPSAGSFFKRPTGMYAGALIESAGLKGVSVGGAQVSDMHAGFLVNTGGATARDFLDLMELVKRRVQENSGVLLEPEVRILG